MHRLREIGISLLSATQVDPITRGVPAEPNRPGPTHQCHHSAEVRTPSLDSYPGDSDEMTFKGFKPSPITTTGLPTVPAQAVPVA
ncbi:MAG: hypothetical protein QOE19_719 [Actinomycetota bacterium]|jgi:hypothetical protein|nr:hypothetical protein [Actinomycetota bacterium]